MEEGDGADFYEDILKKNLPVLPYTVITTNVTCEDTLRQLQDKGVGIILSKFNKSYCPQQVLNKFIVHKKFILSGDTNYGSPVFGKSSRVIIQNIRYQLFNDLGQMGITSKIKGNQYIVEAVLIVRNEGKLCYGSSRKIYEAIANIYETAWTSVERDIRNAIQIAWDLPDNDFREEYYTQRVNPSSGRPSNMEFITFLAKKY